MASLTNPRILYGYMSSGATASASSTDASYDPSNAVALERATGWKAGGTGDQYLILHMGSAITPTGLGICGGNYSSWGTTTLEYSSTGLGGSWTSLLTLSGLGSLTDSVHDYFAKLTAAPSRAYWRLHWTAPSAAPALAVFYLGTLVTLDEPHRYPYDEEKVFGVNVRESEGHVINAERTARTRRRFLPTFDDAGLTLANQIDALIESVNGPLTPYFWVPFDESGSNDYGRAYLVRYTPAVYTLRRVFTDPYNIALPMLEEV